LDIDKIIQALADRKIRITDHADVQTISDHLSIDEIFRSVRHGEIIEEYPKDKPYSSCLIFGKNAKMEPIHSVWAFNSENQWLF